MSWNCGGLTAEVYRELETYAKDFHLDVLMIQESKWTLGGTWSTPDFHFIHSPGTGAHDKVGGLLTVISTRLVKADQIQFRAHHGGRLLHVRVPHGSAHVDILNWYQYAVNAREGTPDRRQKLLVKLQKCIAHLPQRNAFILGGDFNCPCEPHKQTCGTITVPYSPLHYVDCQDHQHVWQTLHLTALNTWHRPTHGQVATFSLGDHTATFRAQIDFIMIRAQHVTALSKQACIVADFPVAGWRGGPRHFPVLADVPVPRPKWSQGTQRSVQPTVQIDGEKIIADLRSPIITPAMASLRQEVQAHLTEHIDSYDELLVQAAHKYYPLKRPTQPVLNEAEALANDARRLWSMFRSMRAHRHSIPGRQWAEFSRAHRIYKARAKQRSKQRKTDLLCQAQQAADKGNAHELWKTVKLLAPKAPKKGLQLHRGGHMITPEEELDWILEAYGERYATDNTQARIKFEFPEHAGFQLHSADLHWYLSHLNPRKAVPKGTAPAVVWKACADIISDPVINTFNAWQDGRPLVLQRWADADVALLPKAHGRSDSPLDWRPIGVQDPLGKCLMSTIILQAKSAIQHLTTRFPQCAYVQNRATSTALCQVFAHCKEVRDRCSKARVNLHQKHEGQQRVKCSGGVQISLDLSAAFDMVEWAHIKQALDFAEVDLAVSCSGSTPSMAHPGPLHFSTQEPPRSHRPQTRPSSRLHSFTHSLGGLHSLALC